MIERMQAPAISVVVPIYNCSAYIEECLGSLKAQTFLDFEVLCVDDGSTDGSLEIARTCVAGDERFWFETLPENRGQSAARNVALDRALGVYVVLLDADDYLVPEALEKIEKRMAAQELDDLYFSALSFYESQKVHELVREDFSQRPSFEGVTTGRSLFSYFEQRGQFFPQAALRAVRRSLIEKNEVRFYEGIIHEDVLFTFQTLAVSPRSSFLNEPLYMRRVRAGSTMTSHKRTIANVRGHFVCVQEIKKWMLDHIHELDEEFIGALTHRMSDYLFLTARDWFHDVDESEKQHYLAELSPVQRLVFFEDVIQPGAVVDQLSREFYESRTYRLGNLFLSIPRAARNCFSRFLRFRRER